MHPSTPGRSAARFRGGARAGWTGPPGRAPSESASPERIPGPAVAWPSRLGARSRESSLPPGGGGPSSSVREGGGGRNRGPPQPGPKSGLPARSAPRCCSGRGWARGGEKGLTGTGGRFGAERAPGLGRSGWTGGGNRRRVQRAQNARARGLSAPWFRSPQPGL